MNAIINKIENSPIQSKAVIKRNFTNSSSQIVSKMKNEIIQYYDNNGFLSWSERKKKYVILGTNFPKNGLVECPQCRLGKLLVIRSRKTKKRFVGCSNYYNGCRASSPLFQKGIIRTTKIPCDACCWPVILIRFSRKQKWIRRCSNVNCKKIQSIA